MSVSTQTTGLIVQVVSLALWFPLKVLGIQAILNAGVRRYPLVFAYSVVTLLLIVVQVPISFAFYRSMEGLQWFQKVYYVSQALIYSLLLAVVLSFIYRASANLATRRAIRLLLIVGGLLYIAITGWLHYDRHVAFGFWVTRWRRDLNLGAAILDLMLWGMLLPSRRPDSRFLLLLSGGLGIMFAGEAIGNAVRDIGNLRHSFGLYYLGHAAGVLADVVFLYVWWQAFRKEAATREPLTASTHR